MNYKQSLERRLFRICLKTSKGPENLGVEEYRRLVHLGSRLVKCCEKVFGQKKSLTKNFQRALKRCDYLLSHLVEANRHRGRSRNLMRMQAKWAAEKGRS